MPVIPALWEAAVGGSPEVRCSRAAGPTWQNPISTKKHTKLAGCGGAHLSQGSKVISGCPPLDLAQYWVGIELSLEVEG